MNKKLQTLINISLVAFIGGFLASIEAQSEAPKGFGLTKNRIQVIPDSRPGSPVQFDKLTERWNLTGMSSFGFIKLEAKIDPSENALIFVGALEQENLTIETRYNQIDDKVYIHGYSNTTGHIYLEISFIETLRLASISGNIANNTTAFEQENVNKDLHWAYVTSTMLASALTIN